MRGLKINKYTLNKKRFNEKVEPLIESRIECEDMMIVSLKTVNPEKKDEGVVIPYEFIGSKKLVEIKNSKGVAKIGDTKILPSYRDMIPSFILKCYDREEIKI